MHVKLILSIKIKTLLTVVASFMEPNILGTVIRAFLILTLLHNSEILL